MKQKVEWCGSSAIPPRRERIKAHEKFQMSELKKMLDNNWAIKSVEVKKRPRIKKAEKKPFKLFGTLECHFEIPIEVLIEAKFL